MSLAIKLGASGWDAAKYVRNLLEDTTPPFTIGDNAFRIYAEDVVEEYSRHIPLSSIAGDPFTRTSPLVTVAGQQRYVLDEASGFSPAPMQVEQVTDVSYAGSAALNIGTDFALAQLAQVSPLSRFFSTEVSPDNPTERLRRDFGLDELARYGRGYFARVQVPQGVALDLYPIPTTGGQPIYVRWDHDHVLTTVDNNTLTVATIDGHRKRDFAKLLYLLCLEERGMALIQAKTVKAGLTEIQQDPRVLEARIERLRGDVVASLGGYTGVGFASRA